MKKKPILERIGDFMAGKGFYIVLFLCVAAIGISGYYLFSSMNGDDGRTVSGLACSHGAGDGTRTREYKLGKLGPYHLATPA